MARSQRGAAAANDDQVVTLGEVKGRMGNMIIRQMTQAAYTALATKDSNTIYLIVG